MSEKKRPDVISELNENERGEPLLETNNAVTSDHEEPDFRGDRANIAILLFLYLLQGIPLGLTAAIPMLLQNRGANYKQQAGFSLTYWPFSLKLLWAPLVDAVFWSKFGRRKSWLIPTQYLIGIFMLVLSARVNEWLEGGHLEQSMPILIAIFFTLSFLAATQDIAVDGWALTMLKRCNVGYASTCNSVGQTAGIFLSYIVFIALESKEFCNNFLRSVPEDVGLITLSGFLWFWGICFLITTTLVALLKRERDRSVDGASEVEKQLNIVDTYKLLWKIMNLRSMKIFTVILLTAKFTFAACDSVLRLKLVEAGIPKDKIALLTIPMVPLQIILPLFVVKYTTGPKPMEVLIKSIPFRMLFGVFESVMVFLTPYTFSSTGDIPIYLYVLLIVNHCLYQIFAYFMSVSSMAFFAKISDPAAGGTYMTLLNTVNNLGGTWPSSVALWLVDVLTWKKCIGQSVEQSFGFINNTCQAKAEVEACTKFGGHCETSIDGYYLECLICLIYGVCWYKWGASRIRHLQSLPLKVWRILKGNESEMINIEIQVGISKPSEAANSLERRTNIDETTTRPTLSANESNDLKEEKDELDHGQTKNGTVLIVDKDQVGDRLENEGHG